MGEIEYRENDPDIERGPELKSKRKISSIMEVRPILNPAMIDHGEQRAPLDNAPYYRWYPWRGTHPMLLRSQYMKYKKHGTRILDPFIGCGTTILTLSWRYALITGCEIYPPAIMYFRTIEAANRVKVPLLVPKQLDAVLAKAKPMAPNKIFTDVNFVKRALPQIELITKFYRVFCCGGGPLEQIYKFALFANLQRFSIYSIGTNKFRKRVKDRPFSQYICRVLDMIREDAEQKPLRIEYYNYKEQSCFDYMINVIPGDFRIVLTHIPTFGFNISLNHQLELAFLRVNLEKGKGAYYRAGMSTTTDFTPVSLSRKLSKANRDPAFLDIACRYAEGAAELLPSFFKPKFRNAFKQYITELGFCLHEFGRIVHYIKGAARGRIILIHENPTISGHFFNITEHLFVLAGMFGINNTYTAIEKKYQETDDYSHAVSVFEVKLDRRS